MSLDITISKVIDISNTSQRFLVSFCFYFVFQTLNMRSTLSIRFESHNTILLTVVQQISRTYASSMTETL